MSGHRLRFPCGVRLLSIAGLVSIMLGAGLVRAATPEAYDPWPGVVQDIFKNRPIQDGSSVIAIEMPYRAEDAAIVPVTLRSKLSPDDGRRLRAITLVIDQNPAPMAARFELGPDANVTEISTRVRVNNYTDVHAVAELSDGQLYIPAFFINEVRLWQDDSLLLTREGGISLSEDPNIRFTYASRGAKLFRAEARDTDGHIFRNEWKIDDSGM